MSKEIIKTATPSSNEMIIALSKTALTKKPVGAEAGAVNYGSNWSNKSMTIKALYEAVALKGYCFHQCFLKDGATRCREQDFAAGYLICFDVDGGTVSPDEYIKTVLEPRGLKPSFYAYSWNDCVAAPLEVRAEYAKRANKPVNLTERKFHVVFCFDRVIAKDTVALIESALAKELNADPAATDVARLLFGSCWGGKLINEEPLTLDACPAFVDVLNKELDTADLPHRPRKLKSVLKATNLDAPTEITIDADADLIGMLTRWNLFNRFNNLERLEYTERVALFINLSAVRWGSEKNTNKLDEYIESRLNACPAGTYEDVEAKIAEYYGIKRKKYLLTRLEDLNGLTVVDYLSVITKGGFYAERNTKDAVDVNTAYELLNARLRECVNNKGVDVITVACGVGKTKAALDYIKTTADLQKEFNECADPFNTPLPPCVVYVAPTYKNLNETAAKLKAAYGLNMRVLPEKNLTETDKRRAACGLRTETNAERAAFMKDFAALKPDETGFACYGITHQLFRLYTALPPRAVYLIDEDINDVYATVDTFTLEDFKAVYNHSINLNGAFYPVVNEDVINTVLKTFPCFQFSAKAVNDLLGTYKEGTEAADDLIKAINADRVPVAPYFKYAANPDDYGIVVFNAPDETGAETTTVAVYAKDYLPANLNITLLTATPKKTLMTAKALNAVRFYELPALIHEGLNVQVYQTGIRKRANKANKEQALIEAKAVLADVVAAIKEHYPEYADKADETFNWLTFKDWCTEAANVELNLAKTPDGSFMYNGATAGLDNLKGSNVAVYGAIKPGTVNYYALYYAYVWNYGMPALEVVDAVDPDNGFKRLTFNVDTMTKIRDEAITGEVMQTVGRARTVREKTITVLFSNVESPDTDVFFYVPTKRRAKALKG